MREVFLRRRSANLPRAFEVEIQRDIEDARLQTSKIVRQVQATYEQPMSNQRFVIVVLAAVLLLLSGICIGRMSAHWWPC